MTAKGCDGIKTAALRRQESLDINPGQKLHTARRKEYCALKAKGHLMILQHLILPKKQHDLPHRLNTSLIVYFAGKLIKE